MKEPVRTRNFPVVSGRLRCWQKPDANSVIQVGMDKNTDIACTKGWDRLFILRETSVQACRDVTVAHL